MAIRGHLKCTEGTAIVQFALPPIPRHLELDGKLFTAKSEFHVTLIGREILKRSGVDDAPATAIADASRGLRFTVDLENDYRIVHEENALTIIRMCSLSGAEELYQRFEAAIGRGVVRPPHHVTLYTLNTSKGIGIATAADLERLSRPLTADEQRAVMRAIT